MAETEHLYVVGAGGAGREVAVLCGQAVGCNSVDFVVERQFLAERIVMGKRVLTLDEIDGRPGRYVVAIGEPGVRERLAGEMTRRGHTAISIVGSPLPSSSIVVEPGAVVAQGVTMTTDIVIRRHAYINVGCTISHDVAVGQHVVVSPGVTICGHVEIGTSAFIGAGATIINGQHGRPLRIGDGAFVAAGACVTQDIAPRTRVAGVPARPIPSRPGT